MRSTVRSSTCRPPRFARRTEAPLGVPTPASPTGYVAQGVATFAVNERFPRWFPPGGACMTAAKYPTRHRRLPHEPHVYAALSVECEVLFDRATELDNAQRALSDELADVRTQLAELRVVMWPSIDGKDIVHGFRLTRRGGPPPIPPVAARGRSLMGKPAFGGAGDPGPQRASDDARRDPPAAPPQRFRDRVA